MKVIETERLRLRAWEIGDANDLYDYAKHEVVAANAGWKTHESIEESKEVIQQFIEGNETYAIVLKENNRVIGSIGIPFRTIDETKSELKQVILGYALNPTHWGNGYMPEAVRAILDYCLNEMRVDLVWCGHFASNENSRRVIEKCGFEFRYQTKRYFEALEKEVEIYQYCIENKFAV